MNKLVNTAVLVTSMFIANAVMAQADSTGKKPAVEKVSGYNGHKKHTSKNGVVDMPAPTESQVTKAIANHGLQLWNFNRNPENLKDKNLYSEFADAGNGVLLRFVHTPDGETFAEARDEETVNNGAAHGDIGISKVNLDALEHANSQLVTQSINNTVAYYKGIKNNGGPLQGGPGGIK